ncbi:MAG: hypothetical protein GDA38_08130 [Hormoscilla sp. SP12CHS1]|nr:hypothetical protein [Hormoscilla sp. SP12CHS1]
MLSDAPLQKSFLKQQAIALVMGFAMRSPLLLVRSPPDNRSAFSILC